MIGSSVLDPKTGRRYFYYECTWLRNRDGRVCGAKVRRTRADALEPRTGGFVSGLLLDPGRLRSGLQAMIEKEEGSSRGDPQRELELWYEKLREAERMRSGYQDLAAKGLLTYEELGGKLAALEETRATARRELEALRGRRVELERLKGDRDADTAIVRRTDGRSPRRPFAGAAQEAVQDAKAERRHKGRRDAGGERRPLRQLGDTGGRVFVHQKRHPCGVVRVDR
jgi:hypothetical protein